MKTLSILKACVAAIAFSMIVGLIAVSGQESRGTVAGRVSDQNDAVVPNATVIIKNVDTNIETTVVTNGEGVYSAPPLNPGKYTLSVSSEGFKKFTQTNLIVSVGDRLTVDVKLEVGSSAQEVNVSADMEVLERGSVTTATTITSRQIEELPLSEGAAYNLALQSPGVAYTGNPQFTGPTSNSNLAAFRSNGAASSQITLDGSPNFAFDGAVAYTPPSDAVQEFRIQTNSFDAQNGYSAGATVNVSVKSGTNKFHGAGSYFDRSKWGTANNFFSNRAGVAKPDRHYYRYGGQVNGPILRNRTFFLAAYERQYTLVPQPAVYSVPTAKMRTGDFSELLPSGIIIYDPATAYRANSSCTASPTGTTICRRPFTGNIIPTGRLNAGALAYLNAFPLPNQAGLTNNYFSNTTNILPYRTFLGRVDHNINNNQKIFGKFFWSKSTDDKYNILEAADAFTRGFENRYNYGGNIVYTATISSSTVFDLHGNFNKFRQQRTPTNPLSASDFGLTGIAAITNSTMAPRFNFTNYTTWGPQRSDYNEGLTRTFNEFSLQPTFTQVHGNHTFRYGYDYRRVYEQRSTNGYNAGNFTTTGTYTDQASSGSLITTNASINGPGAVGRDIASFLLGIPTSGTLDTGSTYNVYSDFHGVFFADDWRVNSKVTLNLGLRYEYEGAIRERNGRLVTYFDPTVPNALGPAALANYNANVPSGIPITAFQDLRGGLIFADSGKAPQQRSDPNNLQPRIGISWALNNKTVIRGGIGIFTAPFQLSGITASQVQTGFTASTTFQASADNGLTFPGTLDHPFPTGLNPAFGSTLGTVTGVGTSLGSITAATGPSAAVLPSERKNANTIRAILGIQRQLPFGIGLEVTGVYSHGYNLAVYRQLNYIPTQYLADLRGVTDYATVTSALSAASTFLTATVPNPFRGTVPSNSTWNGNNLARYRLLTAYPEFQDLITTDYNGTSNFASIQFQATKRLSRGLSFNASYTYSHDREKVRRLNPQDADLTDSVSVASRPHRVTASAIYEVPIGRDRLIGKSWNRVVDAFFGGWQVQGVYEWQSGEPFVLPNAYYNGDPKDLKDLIGKHDANGLAYGIDTAAFDPTGFYLINPTTSAATIPAFGNGYQTSSQIALRYLPYTLNNFRNQPYQKFDAGLTKNFRIREGMKLQVRIEAINAFNWAYFAGMNLTPSVGSTSTFGRVNTQRNLPRDIQLGARFTF